MIVHQIEAMRDAGVTEVVLAINYQPQVMYAFIEEYQQKLGVKITISQARLLLACDSPPCADGGPARLAEGGLGRRRLPRTRPRSQAPPARRASRRADGCSAPLLERLRVARALLPALCAL